MWEEICLKFCSFIDKIYSAKLVPQMFCIVSMLIIDIWSYFSLFGNYDTSYSDLFLIAWLGIETKGPMGVLSKCSTIYLILLIVMSH